MSPHKSLFVKTIGQYSSSLNSAITAIGSTKTTLVIDEAVTLTGNATVPSTLHLFFLRDGKVTLGNYNLTINGQLTAPLAQIFDENGTGKVTIAAGGVPYIYPQWWGAVGDGSTDDVTEIQSALTAARLGGGGIVKLTSGSTFAISDTLKIGSNTALLAYGATVKKLNSTWVLKNYSSDSDDWVFDTACSNISIFGLSVDDNNITSSSYDFVFKRVTNLRIQDCRGYGSKDEDKSNGNINIDGACENVWLVNNDWNCTGGWYIRTHNEKSETYDHTQKNIYVVGNRIVQPRTGWNECLAIFTHAAADIENVVVKGNIIGSSSGSYSGTISIFTHQSGSGYAPKKIQIVGNTLIGNPTDTTGCRVIHIGHENSPTSGGPEEITIVGNNIYGGRYGIFFTHASGAVGEKITIANNNIWGCVRGIQALLPHTTIVGNNIEASTFGIELVALTGVTDAKWVISSNNIEVTQTTSGACINSSQLGGLKKVVITNNVLEGARDSIRIDGLKEVKIQGNTMYPSRYGVYLLDDSGATDTDDVYLIDNLVTGTLTTAYYLNSDATIGTVTCINNTYDGANTAVTALTSAIHRGNSWNYAASAPASGTWSKGTIVWNTSPSAGGDPGWICVTAGSPGTWKAFANVDA